MGENKTVENKPEQIDTLHIEFDIECSESLYRRESIDTRIKSSREVDSNDIIDIVKEELPIMFYTDKFQEKYSSYFSPGDEVDVTLISWIRQPFVMEQDLE